MDEIGAFEAKNTLGTLLDRVERGEEIIITRHGKPVARLVPNTRGADLNDAREALDRIRKRVQRLPRRKSDAFNWPALKKLRDGGRP